MTRRIYSYNENIFKEESERSFYLAGFIAADGCLFNNKKTNEYVLRIDLALADEQFLIEINKLFNSNKVLNSSHRGKSKVLVFNSKNMFDDLKKFNIVPRKSLIYTFPKWLINHPLVNHFMRGYNDGDGSFYLKNNDQWNNVYFELSGTKEFLIIYKNILENMCNLYCKNEVRKRNDKSISRLNYSGKALSSIVYFLYKDATIFLPRKKEIAFKSFKFSETHSKGNNEKA